MYKVEDESDEHSVSSYDSINDLNDSSNDLSDSGNDSSDSKICSDFGSGEWVDLESLRRRIKNPEYVCSSCGRSASEKSSLCWPETL